MRPKSVVGALVGISSLLLEARRRRGWVVCKGACLCRVGEVEEKHWKGVTVGRCAVLLVDVDVVSRLLRAAGSAAAECWAPLRSVWRARNGRMFEAIIVWRGLSKREVDFAWWARRTSWVADVE